MMFFKTVFFTLFIVFMFNIIDGLVQYAMISPVYACNEVTKADPINVQKICNRRWRRE